ncbi:MAG: GNAT family N-acetyltransferase [Rhodobacteraceae bacterium]|nr:GNAT family N-acetyltransferase [Paracoccaceae bacterium]
MTLRLPDISDASSLAALSIEVWIGTYLRRGVSAVFADYALSEFTTPKAEALIRDPGEFIVVSENEEGIDGFVRVSSGKSAPVAGLSDVEISTLYVQPRHHAKGVGKRLLNAAFQHCREIGAGSVWLTTNAQNAPAIAFYLAQGFEEVGKTRFRIQNEGYPNIVYAYRFA